MSNSNSKVVLYSVAVVAVLAVGAAALYLIDVDQKKEAQLPSIEMEVEGGQMPEFDVDVADVSVGTEEVAVEVPDMDVETRTIEIEVPVDADVDMEETTVEVPTIDVDKPREDDPADQPE